MRGSDAGANALSTSCRDSASGVGVTEFRSGRHGDVGADPWHWIPVRRDRDVRWDRGDRDGALDANITATAPTHAAGAVDVVVTNPGGQTEKLTSGYTYVQVDPPFVSAVSPIRGSTGGGTTVTIAGSAFQSAATVTLGNERQTAYVLNSTTILVTTAARAAGTVEIIVTNPDGQVGMLSGAYSYASPQSFDFNGVWEGSALAHPVAYRRSAPRHSDMEMRFTIEGNRLTSMTCGGATVVFPSPPSLTDGAFSHAANDDVISGRIVSDHSAVGTINTGACPATRWIAERR